MYRNVPGLSNRIDKTEEIKKKYFYLLNDEQYVLSMITKCLMILLAPPCVQNVRCNYEVLSVKLQ